MGSHDVLHAHVRAGAADARPVGRALGPRHGSFLPHVHRDDHDLIVGRRCAGRSGQLSGEVPGVGDPGDVGRHFHLAILNVVAAPVQAPALLQSLMAEGSDQADEARTLLARVASNGPVTPAQDHAYSHPKEDR